jgi:hypothetical protein
MGGTRNKNVRYAKSRRILFEGPEETKPFGRPRWDDNIKIVIKETVGR